MPATHRPARATAEAAAVRRFNRFYTQAIGTTARSYLGTGLSLPEARVLFEVATLPGCTAKGILARARFDQGHLSRILARLARSGLVAKTPLAADRREQALALTARGRRTFAALDRRADGQAAQLLAGLAPAQRREILDCFRRIEALLGGRAAEGDVRIRAGRVGDLGWMFHRQAVVYAREFGYSPLFERYVCQGLPPFLDRHDPALDRLWIAEVGHTPVGFIAIQHDEGRPGWAKLRWFLVEREGRGRGVGGRLLAKAIGFARRAGYAGILLWTVSDLHAARRLYQRAGFRLAEEKSDCAWAPWAREQRWEMGGGWVKGKAGGGTGERRSPK